MWFLFLLFLLTQYHILEVFLCYIDRRIHRVKTHSSELEFHSKAIPWLFHYVHFNGP